MFLSLRRLWFGSRDVGGGLKVCPRCGGNDMIFEGPEGGAVIHVKCLRCNKWYLG